MFTVSNDVTEFEKSPIKEFFDAEMRVSTRDIRRVVFDRVFATTTRALFSARIISNYDFYFDSRSLSNACVKFIEQGVTNPDFDKYNIESVVSAAFRGDENREKAFSIIWSDDARDRNSVLTALECAYRSSEIINGYKRLRDVERYLLQMDSIFRSRVEKCRRRRSIRSQVKVLKLRSIVWHSTYFYLSKEDLHYVQDLQR